MRVCTIGHGTRPVEELVETLRRARAETLVDVRRFPGSRRNPQFNQEALAATLEKAGIAYRHAVELGGRLTGEPGEERFACIRVGAFRRTGPGTRPRSATGSSTSAVSSWRSGRASRSVSLNT